MPKIALFENRSFLNDLPAKLLSLAAAILLFFFNRMDTVKPRYITAPIRLEIPSELTPSQAYTKRVRVLLRGPQDVIEGVLEDDIEVVADFSESRGEGIYTVPLQILRRGSAQEAENIEISLETPNLTLDLERKITRVMEVTVPLVGNLEPGLQLESLLSSPSTVTAEGARTLVQALRTADTENLDLTGRLESFTARLRLASPDPLVEFRGGSVIEVRAEIVPVIEEKEISDIPLLVTGLSSNLMLGGELPLVRIRLRGPQIQLNLTDAQTLAPTLNLDNINQPGTYTLQARWNLDPRIQVLEQTPQTVTVSLEAR